MATKRTIVIEPGVDPDTGEMFLRLDDANARVLRLMGTLAEVGGILRIVSDRVKIGELPGPRHEPLAETVGFVIEFEDKVPLHAESITRRMMDLALTPEAPVAEAPQPASLADEITEERPAEAMPAADDGDDGGGVILGDEPTTDEEE